MGSNHKLNQTAIWHIPLSVALLVLLYQCFGSLVSGECSRANAWWLGLSPCGPAGHNSKRWHGPTRLPGKPTTCRRHLRGWVQCGLGGSWENATRLPKLAIDTWNVTTLVGKEPEKNLLASAAPRQGKQFKIKFLISSDNLCNESGSWLGLGSSAIMTQTSEQQ